MDRFEQFTLASLTFMLLIAIVCAISFMNLPSYQDTKMNQDSLVQIADTTKSSE